MGTGLSDRCGFATAKSGGSGRRWPAVDVSDGERFDPERPLELSCSEWRSRSCSLVGFAVRPDAVDREPFVPRKPIDEGALVAVASRRAELCPVSSPT